MTKRKGISKRTRFEIFKRDQFTCQYCGGKPPAVILWVDHILAVSAGGDNERDNLAPSCDRCNQGKSDVPLEQVVKSLAETLKVEKEKSEQMAIYNEWLKELRLARSDDFYLVSDAIVECSGDDPEKIEIAGKRSISVRTILKHLPVQRVLEAIEIAHSRFNFKTDGYTTFRYFCGCCWRMIREQEPTVPDSEQTNPPDRQTI